MGYICRRATTRFSAPSPTPRAARFSRGCAARARDRARCHRSGRLAARLSKHLGALKQAGLVRDRHVGRETHYSAQPGALAPLIDWTSSMVGFWQDRFDKLEDLLRRMDQ